MCEPTTLAIGSSLATFGLGAAESIYGQRGQERAYQANKAAADAKYRADIEALGARETEVNRAASDEIIATEIEALQARGRAKLLGTGMADISIGEVLTAVNQEAGRAKSTSRYNRDINVAQIQRDKSSAGVERGSRVNSVSRGSNTAAAFGIGGAALKGLTQWSILKDRGSK